MTASLTLANLLDPAALNKLGRLEVIAKQAVERFIRSGIHRSRATGQGEEFRQYQVYTPGDDLRRLDWHLFAKTDQLFTKRQTPDTTFRLAIIIDDSESMNYCGASSPCTKFRYSQMAAATIAYLALRRGDQVRIFPYSNSNTPSTNNLEVLCSALERLSTTGASMPDDAVAKACDFAGKQGMVLWFSDLHRQEEQCHRLCKCLQNTVADCYLIQLLDYDEVNLPFQLPATFADAENSDKIAVDPPLALQDYQQRFQSFLKTVQNAALSHNIHYNRLLTTCSLADAIAGVLKIS